LRKKLTAFADRFVFGSNDHVPYHRCWEQISQKDAIRLGTSGPTLRATGVEKDLKREMEVNGSI